MKQKRRLLCAYCGFVAVGQAVSVSSTVAEDIIFADVAAERGLGSYVMAPGHCAGVAAADYDNDGDIDLFVPQGCGVADMLYANDGSGNFIPADASVGVGSLANSRVALWFDYDDDGDLDLLVAHDNTFDSTCNTRPFTLYRQDAPDAFTDVTVAAGLELPPFPEPQHAAGMCAGDIDNDGDLDLCTTSWVDGGAKLFRNDGDGTFTDVSDVSGISSTHPHPWQPMMFDADADGWLDIFIAVDFLENHLWINDGDGSFTDKADVAGVDKAWNEMGVSIGDFDNDSRLDLYVTNIDVDLIEFEQHNALYRNVGSPGVPAFEDVSVEQGVADGWWDWGTTMFDADCDGLLDIAATNGHANGPYLTDPSRLFMNTGTTFVDSSTDTGFDDTLHASCLISFDADRDGDQDVLQICHNNQLRLLNNAPVAARGAANHWLTVRPRQTGPNSFAIGAVVKITVNGTTMTRLIHAGCSTLGQEPAEAHFGIGEATLIQRVTVEWPDGTQTTRSNIAADQVLTVMPTCPGDADANGQVGLSDLLAVIGNWGSTGPNLNGDLDDDDSVGLSDLLLVIGHWGSSC